MTIKCSLTTYGSDRRFPMPTILNKPGASTMDSIVRYLDRGAEKVQEAALFGAQVQASLSLASQRSMKNIDVSDSPLYTYF